MTAIIMVDGDDPTPDRLIAELRRRGVAVAYLDPALFPDRLGLAAELTGEVWTGEFSGDDRDACTIDTDGRADLAGVTGVFYRRPRGYQCSLGRFVEGENMHPLAQARLGFGGLLCAVASWANHPQDSGYAEYLPVQLRTAHEIGLRVPRTCITNDPAAAHRFVGGLERAIRKPFRGHDVDDGWIGRARPAFVSPTDCNERVAGTVHLFQEWIPAEHAVRLTVVDDRQFAARTTRRPGTGPETPNMSNDSAADCHPILVTPPIRHAVTELMRRFRLRFAAFDFLVDADERWWYLGCDPNPQWAHIEDRAGLPITAALADALLGRSGGRAPDTAPDAPAVLSAPGPPPAR